MKTKRSKWMVIGGTWVVVMWGLYQLPAVDQYVNGLQSQADTAYRHQLGNETSEVSASNEQEDALLQTIRAEAAKQDEPPVNARVDRVWKAIPGYNGVVIDIEETWRLARQTGVTSTGKIPYVYKEVMPDVRLEDLGAQPIYKGNPRKKMASLMINVAWGDEYIPTMLDVLKEEGVKATFFFDGSWLNKNIETAKTIQAQGHEMSNHAYTHPNMSTLSREAAIREMDRTQALLRDKLGVTNTLFAPPSGDFDEETVKLAHELNMKTVLWTLDTVDWKKPSPASIVTKIQAHVEPGTMILMHPTSSSSQALRGMIQAIRQKGLVIGTVSELLSSDRIPPMERNGI